MKKIKILVLFLSVFLFSKTTKAQNQTIYFLVDTINVAKANRVVEIDRYEMSGYTYRFFCKCIAPYREFPEFLYLKKDQSKEFSNVLPPNKYMNWKDLSEALQKSGRYFESDYTLYITEVLPGNKYKTNKVKLMSPGTYTKDGVELQRH